MLQQAAIWDLVKGKDTINLDEGEIKRALTDETTAPDSTPAEGKDLRNAYFANIAKRVNESKVESTFEAPVISKMGEYEVVKEQGYIKVKNITVTGGELTGFIVEDAKGNRIKREDFIVRKADGTIITDDNINSLISGAPFQIEVKEKPEYNLVKLVFGVQHIQSVQTRGEVFTPKSVADHQPVIKITRVPVIADVKVDLPISAGGDVALRKFITKINGEPVAQSREPVVTQKTDTVSRRQTTAHYAHTKKPLVVAVGDVVTYKMRLYNETTAPITPKSVIDILPKGLKLDKKSDINKDWKVIQEFEDGRTVIENKNLKGTPIPGAILAQSETDQSIINFIELEVDIKIEKSATTGIELTNIAYINTQVEPDDDSVPGNKSSNSEIDFLKITNDMLKDYRGRDNDVKTLDDPGHYFKGYEDDDDFEKVILIPFDLALRKHIIEKNGKPLEDNDKRDLSFDTAKLIDGTSTTSKFPKKEAPLKVNVGDVIKYKIRVYNEGDIDGIAKEITDYLPSGLGYLANHETNLKYGWKISDKATLLTNEEKEKLPGFKDVVDLTKIKKEDEKDKGKYTDTPVDALNEVKLYKGNATLKTNYLDNIVINAFDKTKGNEGLSYKEIEIVAVVLEEIQSTNLRNVAEISKDSDKDGNIIKDRDSVTNNVKKHFDGPYEDDEDYEDLVTDYFDLSLRKFITHVNDDSDPTTQEDKKDREPQVDVSGLINKTSTTAKYVHTKTPVLVEVGDLVTYKIRVYNEGSVDGYVKEIVDHLPSGLGFLVQHKKNIENGWEYMAGTGTEKRAKDYTTVDFKFRKQDLEGVDNLDDVIIIAGAPNVKTEILKGSLIRAFDGKELAYKDVEIVAVVLDSNLFNDKKYIGNLRNVAEISKHAGTTDKPVKDRDSTPWNVDKHFDGPYEDDEDYEDLTTVKKEFDLALRKFITTIKSDDQKRAKDKNELKNRIPRPMIDEGKIKYEHDKTPLIVARDDKVVYTIRVYNEGEIDGFAKKVRDTLPEGLTYLEDSEINKKYGWYFIDENGNKVDDIKKAKYIETEYLSRDAALEREKKGEKPGFDETIILAFDKKKNILHARDLEVEFVVNKNAKPGLNNLKNIAEISDDEDRHGNPVLDKDSTPGNNNPGEDDIDEEDLKTLYFDLALQKIISHVDMKEGGVSKSFDTGHKFDVFPEPIVKIDLHEKKLSTVSIKYTYRIRVENQGEIEGYARKVADYIPKGLEFHEEDQVKNKWKMIQPGLVETSDLESTLLKPGDKVELEIVLRWKNHRNNMGVKTNVAEISEDFNEFHVPDIDSTPNNRVPGEDDIDDASTMIVIRTGKDSTYFTLIITMTTIIGLGVYVIKKYIA